MSKECQATTQPPRTQGPFATRCDWGASMMLKAPSNGSHKVGCSWNQFDAWWTPMVVELTGWKDPVWLLGWQRFGASIPGSCPMWLGAVLAPWTPMDPWFWLVPRSRVPAADMHDQTYIRLVQQVGGRKGPLQGSVAPVSLGSRQSTTSPVPAGTSVESRAEKETDREGSGVLVSSLNGRGCRRAFH